VKNSGLFVKKLAQRADVFYNRRVEERKLRETACFVARRRASFSTQEDHRYERRQLA
jgi:hypothetical protein